MITVGYEKHLVIQLSYWLIHITWCQTGRRPHWRDLLTFIFVTCVAFFVDGGCDSVCYVLLQAGYLDSLSSSEFVRLTRMVEDFVMDCERICGRQSHSLRATLLTQAKKFVERFHEERRNKLR